MGERKTSNISTFVRSRVFVAWGMAHDLETPSPDRGSWGMVLNIIAGSGFQESSLGPKRNLRLDLILH